MKPKRIFVATGVLIAGFGVLAVSRAQEGTEPAVEMGVVHAECTLFAPEGEQFRAVRRERFDLSAMTARVWPMLGASHTRTAAAVDPVQAFDYPGKLGLIDQHIWQAIRDAGIKPAALTNDYEFCRRVTLDLSGRVPTYDRLLQFVNDPARDKRARYIEELIASPGFTDKWTMFFGDLYEIIDFNTQVRPYPEGRNAFQAFVKASIAANKKYDVMVREMIAATGENSWEQGELNWFVLGFMGGGPAQDIADLQAAIVAEKFLGISHENCVLCHDGRRHLDTLSLWGKVETRRKGWELAAFFGKSQMQRVPAPNAVNGQPYYYRVIDRANLADYALNTTTGNRPARQPIGTLRNVAPKYPFGDGTGQVPQAGESYRAALGRLVTSDIQFARATVNYVWKQMFGRGIVDPPNQFDPARLDPDNPPPAESGWTLQPSHPRLLGALARDFQKNQFDLRWLFREIANSEAYQLSSKFEGEWRPDYEKLFPRKYLRRLWGEEVVDAIAQVSGMPVTYAVNGGMEPVSWAMQLPQTRGLGNATVPVAFRLAGIANTYQNTTLMDAFLRGNRIEEERRPDGSVNQVLNLMNDRYVHDRTRAVGAGPTASLARRMLSKYPSSTNDSLLINELFLTVLSRPSTEDEQRAAQVLLSQGNRQQKVEDLLWSLYNKVDFIYNY
jgi:hypothetical protein